MTPLNRGKWTTRIVFAAKSEYNALAVALLPTERHDKSARRTHTDKSGVKNMGVKEIELAIEQLSAKDLAELAAWFADYAAEMWDKQIEQDLTAGRLDALLKEVDEEYEAGLSQPL
jgi:hypothetical protein